jgi:hypothetical protein
MLENIEFVIFKTISFRKMLHILLKLYHQLIL